MELSEMQLDVIQILAGDEKGYSNRGLAELLNKYESSTKRAMEGLQIDIAGAGKEPLYIHYLDIKNPVGLVSMLLIASDPVSKYISDSSSEIRSISLKDIDLFWNGTKGLMSVIWRAEPAAGWSFPIRGRPLQKGQADRDHSGPCRIRSRGVRSPALEPIAFGGGVYRFCIEVPEADRSYGPSTPKYKKEVETSGPARVPVLPESRSNGIQIHN